MKEWNRWTNMHGWRNNSRQSIPLQAVAYWMLGYLAEAEDAVQEPWLRLSRSDTGYA
jgi:DNA-directed RNA polymerase specialized sigma24 family protein